MHFQQIVHLYCVLVDQELVSDSLLQHTVACLMFMMAESIGGGRARQENDIGCLKANVVTGLEMVLVAVTSTTRNPALMHPLH